MFLYDSYSGKTTASVRKILAADSCAPLGDPQQTMATRMREHDRTTIEVIGLPLWAPLSTEQTRDVPGGYTVLAHPVLAHYDLYRIGRGEQGVLLAEPGTSRAVRKIGRRQFHCRLTADICRHTICL
jgi:hypothetical protein